MVVAGLFETMHNDSKSYQHLASLSENPITESIKMSSFINKMNKKKTIAKSTYRSMTKTEYHSSFTRVVLPHYTLRNMNIDQEHIQVLRICSFVLIAMNSAVIGVDSVSFSNKTRRILRILDFSLLLLFYCEIFVKLLFQKHFFKRFINKIDLMIFLLNFSVQIYLLITHCDFLGLDLDCDKNNLYELVRVFQVLRIIRILISSVWINISILILEFVKILRKMYAFLMFLMIFLMLFTLIGRNLFNFSNIPHEIHEETLKRLNFNGFLSSFFSNFLIFSAEEWHLIMFSTMRTFPSTEATVYFVINLVFCTIFLNKVFLAALISNLIESKNIKRIIEGKPFILSNKIKQFFNKILDFFSFRKENPSFYEPKSTLKSTFKDNKTAIKSVISIDKSRKILESKKTFNKGFIEIIIKIRKNQKFSNFMIFSVICSLVILALHDPFQPSDSYKNMLLTYCDIPIFFVFSIELLLELIPHENGFFSLAILLKIAVCAIYLFYFIFQLELLKLLLIFRLFLLINFSTELKLAFKALLKSMLDVLQLFFFFLLITLLFALIGVKCLRGAFYHCEGLTEEFLDNVINNQDCFDFGGDWVNRDFNFDNPVKALEIMFMVANTEGWLPLMYLLLELIYLFLYFY